MRILWHHRRCHHSRRDLGSPSSERCKWTTNWRKWRCRQQQQQRRLPAGRRLSVLHHPFRIKSVRMRGGRPQTLPRSRNRSNDNVVTTEEIDGIVIVLRKRIGVLVRWRPPQQPQWRWLRPPQIQRRRRTPATMPPLWKGMTIRTGPWSRHPYPSAQWPPPLVPTR